MRVAARKALSLDKEFDNSNERLNAIIADLNAGLIPNSRYHELLHANFFENDTKNGLGINSKTFINYAIKKLKDPNAFLFRLRWEIGEKQFNYYMKSQNYLQCGEKLKSFTTYDLYQQDKGAYNLEPLSEMQMKVLHSNTDGAAVVEQIKVHTHNTSSHKTADESHVTAFRMMTEALKLDVNAIYEKPIRASDPSRKVIIEDRGDLDAHITKELKELEHQVNKLVQMSDEQIFHKYLRHNDIKQFKKLLYSKLEGDDKIKFDNEIKGFRFQANAAQRYMNDMMNNHEIPGKYAYKTNVVNSCGLTIEEMLATAYWASKDKSNFKNNGVTEIGNFILLIKYLHDIRRGYDVDDKVDQPDINEYPEEAGEDHSRCDGGASNSIANALETTHKAYNNRIILRPDIEKALKDIYKKIIDENQTLLNSATMEELQSWKSTGKITGKLAEALRKEFDEKHKAGFVEENSIYLNAKEFSAVVSQGLDNIDFPEQLEEKVTPVLLENLLNQEIYTVITNQKLPLMHLDKTGGYESTLNYLTRIGHINLIPTLIRKLLDEWVTQPSAQRAIWFLCRSNLPDEYKHQEIFKVEDVSITLADLSTLNENELSVLFLTQKKNLLRKCIEKDLKSLFALYFDKLRFTKEELDIGYGYQNLKPLFWAAQKDCNQVVTTFLESDFSNKTDILLLKDKNSSTLLHYYISNAKIELITTILNTKDVDISKLLGAKNDTGSTPLHVAVEQGNIQILTALLETKSADLNARDVDGDAPLDLAISNRNEVVANILLKYGASPSLSMLINNTFSSETNSQLRANYLYTSTAYKVAQTVSNAVTSGLDAIRLRVTISHEISL